MEYTTHTLILIAVIVTLASILQSLVGFGFALFAVPPLLLLQVPLPQAVAIALAGTFMQGAVAAVRLHGQIQWRAIAPLTTMRLLLIPVGILLMALLVELGETQTKQGVGAVLLLSLIMWGAVRVQPRERLHAGWGVAAGIGSGLLGGSVGMGGPPCVLWALGHHWSSEQLRASLFTIFSLTVPAEFVLLRLKFGMEPIYAGLFGLALTPLVIAGTTLGLWLSSKLPTAHLRRAMIGLLAVLAVYAIVQPFFQR
ncbi:MAG: TSUP family transporter [Armatimonadota bacterium]